MSNLRKSTKKTLLVITLICLLSAIPGAAAAEISLIALPFKDVPTTHWGIKDIVKLDLRSVVAGYSDGKFYPSKPVTQMEALLLAVRNLEAEDQISLLDSTETLPVTVPLWASTNYKKEILYAIEEGLLVPEEDNFSANENASRAWVAQLMVRMMDKNTEAEQSAGETAGWSDAADIPDWALGSVNVAARYKLVTGYPDNTFRPNGSITRAELVTMLSRSEQYLTLSGRVQTAKLISVSGSNVTLLINGTVKTTAIDSGTWVFDSQGKLASSASLAVNDAVKVILNGTTLKYLEILPADAVVSKLEGTVLQALPSERVLIVKDDAQKVVTVNLASTTSSDVLDSLETDSRVELGLNSSGEAVSVQLLTDAAVPGGTLIINNLNTDQKLLVLKNSAGKVTAYQYTDQLVVKVSGQRFPTIKDLQVGDAVKIVAEGSVISEIELVKANQQLKLTGKVVLISTDKRIITVQKTDDTLQAYSIADSAGIEISGLSYPQLSSLDVDDQVELTIEDGLVTNISVLDRIVDSTITGTVTAVDTGNRILTIKNEDDKLQALEVSSNAEFLIDDDSTSSLSAVKKDMKVEVQLIDDKVMYLQTKEGVEGTLLALDKNRHTLTLKTAKDGNKTYQLADDPDVNIEGDSSTDLGDLNNNDYIEVVLDDDEITKINVQKVNVYEITTVYKNNDELKVKDEDGDTRYLTLDGWVTLQISGEDYPGISDFSVGDTVKATFLGDKLTKVELVPGVHGKITSVTASTNTIVIQIFGGSVKTYTFNGDCKVLTDGSNTANFSSLTVGDRVEVRENANGGYTFDRMEKVTGQFQTYDASDKEITLIRQTSYYTYNFASDLYTHTGAQTLTLSSLTKGNSVDVYLLDDVAYEVEKK